MSQSNCIGDVEMVCDVQARHYIPRPPRNYRIACVPMAIFKRRDACWGLEIDALWAITFPAHTIETHEQKLEAAQWIATASEDDMLVGYTLACPAPDLGEHVFTINEVCCQEDAQGQGLGLAIVETILRQLQSQGAAQVYLTCNSKKTVGNNGRLLTDFYSYLGFRTIDPATAQLHILSQH